MAPPYRVGDPIAVIDAAGDQKASVRRSSVEEIEPSAETTTGTSRSAMSGSPSTPAARPGEPSRSTSSWPLSSWSRASSSRSRRPPSIRSMNCPSTEPPRWIGVTTVATDPRRPGVRPAVPPPARPRPPELDELWTVEQLAEFLKIPTQSVYKQRSLGTGPPGYRVGKYVRFKKSDVMRWLEEHRDAV
jgi:excisionase family DNA binding protein